MNEQTETGNKKEPKTLSEFQTQKGKRETTGCLRHGRLLASGESKQERGKLKQNERDVIRLLAVPSTTTKSAHHL